ncbi:MAG: PilZ domain-containing protein, partial [Terriglobia bacterium]
EKQLAYAGPPAQRSRRPLEEKMATSPGDRRSYQRTRFERPLRGKYKTRNIQLRDLSVMGAFIDNDLGLAVGQRLPLTIWLREDDPEPIQVQAIVRSLHDKGMGVEFVGLSRPNFIRLHEFLRAAQAPPGA